MTDLETKDIKTFDYERPSIEKGYANQTLYVNISDSEISIKPVTEKMKEVFIGGKDFDLWLHVDSGHSSSSFTITLQLSLSALSPLLPLGSLSQFQLSVCVCVE